MSATHRIWNDPDHHTQLVEAARNGNADDVRRFIPLCDPKYNYSEALCAAAEHGRAECVRLLLPVSDPQANNSEALYWAAQHGQTIIRVSAETFGLPRAIAQQGSPAISRHSSVAAMRWPKTDTVHLHKGFGLTRQ